MKRVLLLLGSLAAVAVQSGCSSSHQTQKKPPPVFGPPAVFHWGVHRHFPAGQWPTGKSVYCAGEGSSAGAKVPPPGHRVASSGGITIQTRGDGSIDIHCQPSANSRQGRLGKIFWRGDFETGNLSQWSTVQAVPGDVRVVTSPVRQ